MRDVTLVRAKAWCTRRQSRRTAYHTRQISVKRQLGYITCRTTVSPFAAIGCAGVVISNATNNRRAYLTLVEDVGDMVRDCQDSLNYP
jgi:hypothetical protein